MTVHFRSHFTDAIKATGRLAVEDADTRWACGLWGNVLLLTSFIGQSDACVPGGRLWVAEMTYVKSSSHLFLCSIDPKSYSTLSSACLLLWLMILINIYHPCVHCVCVLCVCTVCVNCMCILRVCTVCHVQPFSFPFLLHALAVMPGR